MSSASDVLKVAAGEIGYYAPNDPEPGSKYGRWMAEKTGESWLSGPSTSVWWCMIFVSWCFEKAGASFAALPSYNTDATVSRVREGKGGTLLSNVKDAQAGDIVVFDWNMKTAATDHVGIVEKNCGGYIQTIEGNTSGSDWGSQSAGNGVHRRTRSWSVVRYIIRPPYDGASVQTTTTATTATSNGGGLEMDGYMGTATIKRAQQVAGMQYQDGILSSQNAAFKSSVPGCTSGIEWVSNPTGSTFWRWFQGNVLGTAQDGIMGRNDVNAMIRKYGNGIQDGRLDAPSVAIKGLQSALNAGHF